MQILNNERISQLLFYIFIFFLPWQTRWILFSAKIEYLSFSIYLSEIFLWFALGFWLVENINKVHFSKTFIVFYIFILSSLLWADNFVAGFRLSLYIFEGMLVYEYIKNNKEITNKAIHVFLLSIYIASIFAIVQFMALGSEANTWLGVAYRGAYNLGDIVVEAEGGRFLRAYGPLPHPNIFAGYLAVAILFILKIIKEKKDLSMKYGYYFLSGFFLLIFFLTFSRSAFIALLFVFLYFIFKNLNRSDIRRFALFIIIITFILSYIFLPFIKSRTSDSFIESRSNTERIKSLKAGINVWTQYPVLGVGIGNYITSSKLKEPPHNVFLLILSELGFLGFLLYLFLLQSFWQSYKLRYFLILFLIIGFFDHYLWSLYPGVLLFWTSLSLSE